MTLKNFILCFISIVLILTMVLMLVDSILQPVYCDSENMDKIVETATKVAKETNINPSLSGTKVSFVKTKSLQSKGTFYEIFLNGENENFEHYHKTLELI